MLRINILQNFKYTPVIMQSLVLAGAILVFDYVIKPSIIDAWAIVYTNFLAYSLYTITLLGIIEGYLRASALRMHIEFSKDCIYIKKTSFIPFQWYNRKIRIPYSSLKNLIISKEPVDLSKGLGFFSRFRKKFPAAFFKKQAKKRHDDNYYITFLQNPEFDEFSFGILNFRADISLYNNPVDAGDVAKIINESRQKTNLKFVFN